MPEDSSLQETLDRVRSWDYIRRTDFYEKFPETVKQQSVNELFGVNQHEDEEFGEGYDYSPDDLDGETLETLQDDLSTLSAIAGREAASAQNLTVYGHVMDLWRVSDEPSELFEYLESYSGLRSEWNERNEIEGQEHLKGREQADFGEEEYVEEIVEDIVEKTIMEV
jgi:hypothetical protein